MGWIRTWLGHKIDPFRPDPDAIDIKDIAHSLSLQCRWTGHVDFFFSVAQHSLLVAEILPEELKLEGLLHDAAEVYMSDIPKPIKPNMGNYEEAEDRLLEVIFKKFNLEWPIPDKIWKADKISLSTEKSQLFSYDGPEWGHDLPDPHPIILTENSPKIIEIDFLHMFKIYGGKS